MLALSGLCLVAPMEGQAARRSKKHPSKTATSAQKPKCETCEAIHRLEEKIAAQQAEIDALKAAQQAQTATADEKAAAAAAAAQQQAADAAKAAADAQAKAKSVQADLAGLKGNDNSQTESAAETQKRLTELEHPSSLRFKGIELTPGGYLADDILWRQHAENTGSLSTFNGIPAPGSRLYGLTEYRTDARQSRLSLLAQGKAGSVKLTGYYEMDFQGAAPTANENQTNSFNIRQRQLFGELQTKGWSITAGQMWSLLTMNKKGIQARGEWAPWTSDANYVPGYTYVRLPAIRVAKSFDNDRWTGAFALEQSAYLVGGTGPGTTIYGGNGTVTLTNGTPSSTFTTAVAPDLIAKVAFDPGFGHYELKAIGRFFREGVAGTNAYNDTTVAGGIGMGAIVPVLPKKLDLVGQLMVGRGIGRYGDSSKVDVTYRPNGSFSPVQDLQALAGIQAHPTSRLAWYLYGGEEYQGKDAYGSYGYGLSTNDLKNVVQGTTGFWYNAYRGGYGTVNYGMQYSYTYRSTWHPAGSPALRASESMAFTSLRYILP